VSQWIAIVYCARQLILFLVSIMISVKSMCHVSYKKAHTCIVKNTVQAVSSIFNLS